MTNPGEDAAQTASSGSSSETSEPASGGYEAPPIEQSQEPPATPEAPQVTDQPSYTPPPAYNTPSAPPSGYETPGYPPASGYPPPGFPPPQYTPQPSYPPPGAQGYAPPPYPDPSSYSTPSYPPPQYGTPPPGYGPPPAGYPAPNYAGAYGQPTQTTNSLAIASLVASAIGVLCCIGGIVGIVLGVVSLNQIKSTCEGGRGLAIAGIAVGAATLLFSLLVTIAAVTSS